MLPIRSSSLDSWLAGAAVLVIGLSLLLAVLTSAITTSLYRSVAEMSNLVQGARVAGELQSEVLNQARLHGMELAFGAEHYGVLEQVSRSRIGSLIAEAAQYAGDPAERHLVDEIRAELDAVFHERDHLAASDSPLEMLRRSGPRLEPIVASVEKLQAINSEEASEMATRAARLNRLADIGAVSAFGAILSAAAMLAWLAHRHIRRPLLRLSRSLRMDEGAIGPLVEDEGPVEVRQVARAFNELAEAHRRVKKGELETLAGVVHDLKNPLAGSRMLLPVLSRASEQGDAATVRRIVDLLDRELAGLRDMTSDLLDSVQMQAGALQMEHQDVDMTRLLRETADVMGHSSGGRTLEVSMPREPVMVAGDERRLCQVLRNLLDNAIKYSPAGGRVAVSLETRAARAVLTVRDEGIGMTREEVDSLFRPFWRSQRARREMPGAGIGLSVVHRIVSAHGGSIHVQSEPGRGSTFQVDLPRAVEPAQTAVQAAGAPS